MLSSPSSQCAVCKFLRQQCKQECVFAPYFPQQDRQKFLTVYKVFGASHVYKLLTNLPAEYRENAVSSLVYEATTRLNDPVYGCFGVISVLQQQLRHFQNEFLNLRQVLSAYIGAPALSAHPHPHNSGGGGGEGGGDGGEPIGIPSTLVAGPQTQMRVPQHQLQGLDNQHIAAAISNNEQQAGASAVDHDHLSLQQQILQLEKQLQLQLQLQRQQRQQEELHFQLHWEQQEQQLHLQQQQEKLHLEQLLHLQQQKKDQARALHLRDAGDDKHIAGPSC